MKVEVKTFVVDKGTGNSFLFCSEAFRIICKGSKSKYIVDI
jgi:hypothetical protein